MFSHFSLIPPLPGFFTPNFGGPVLVCLGLGLRIVLTSSADLTVTLCTQVGQQRRGLPSTSSQESPNSQPTS